MDARFLFLVGVDWATDEHRVCLMHASGKKISERTVPHSGTGITQFLNWITEQTMQPADRVGVAIEVPRGAIVETLAERGYAVFSINPKQLDRFRDRHSVAGAKDDSLDAFVLADSLRTDLHCFQPVHVGDPLIIRIRDLSRLEDDLRQDWSRLTNQLRDQLHRYYPQLLHLSPAADEPWLWELLELAPFPTQACTLKKRRIEKLLSQYRICRLSATQVISELVTQPLQVAPGTAESAAEVCLLLVVRLKGLYDQKAEVAKRVETVLDQLTLATPAGSDKCGLGDAKVLRSLPGVGRVVAATMLAEASQALAERNYQALRSYSGIAPVTRQSGKKRQVIMRYGCNARLRHALYHWSRVSVQLDQRSREHYLRLRQAGHSHGRALRGIADRLLAVLIAMLKNQTLYDPDRRAGTQCNQV
ncbi:MAG: IS110 family transposase [Acidobacteriota bacterium]|nr:IS110 family transposase [Acidobacteriota bacterium]